ncbi:putative immunity protein [Pedobacter miscanthi]|uniref:Imm-5-like domain-containing protein n=1 Tax=Pedobacter miscanthi TaxID=2259170 RepID=A0A366KNU9_9SPHI|nr:hypothetical protein [Pedobacter miscanthi]RBQ03341.1 hypothetical protein DRW42_22455 [Pedobacter miscanthi]
MPSQSKIKFSDYPNLRIEIDKLNDNANQVILAKWAINCAKHILPLAKNENIDFSVIEAGFKVNEQWQVGKATVHEVRKAGFKIHAVARKRETSVGKNAIRTAGQAVAVGHMREHAMVCADYAIKTIGLAFPDDLNRIKKEREWQLEALKQEILNNE